MRYKRYSRYIFNIHFGYSKCKQIIIIFFIAFQCSFLVARLVLQINQTHWTHNEKGWKIRKLQKWMTHKKSLLSTNQCHSTNAAKSCFSTPHLTHISHIVLFLNLPKFIKPPSSHQAIMDYDFHFLPFPWSFLTPNL